MLTLVDDLRFGFRLLFSRPLFTLVAVATLSIGITVTTAMFGVLDHLYGKALTGVAEPDRLVELETIASDGSLVRTSWQDFLAYRGQVGSLSGVAARADAVLTTGSVDGARPLRTELVSSNYFEVLGIAPAVGSFFSPATQPEVVGAHPVVIISHRYWRNEFRGNRNIIGSTLRLNRREFTILGVTPPTFRSSIPGLTADLWVPITMGVELGVLEPATFRDAIFRNVYPFGRLTPNASLAQARLEVTAAASHLAAHDRIGHQGVSATLEPMWRARIHGRAVFLQPMLLLFAVSLLVLGIVCGNVANLLLGRSASRLQEFSIRVALGASRWRVTRLLFIETLLLSLAAAVFAIPLAMWTVDALVLLLPKMVRADAVRFELDLRILSAAAFLAVAAAAASSVAQLLFVLRSSISDTLREGGRSGRAGARSGALRTALIVSEVAVAQIVLIGAGLTFQSYRNASRADLGFEPENVLLADFSTAAGGHSAAELQSFCRRLSDKLAGSPQVQALAFADYAPLWSTDGAYSNVRPEGFLPRSPADLKVHRTAVSPGYFSLLQIPIREGRDFTPHDTRNSAGVIIVDQAFARRFYGGGSPIGRRVEIGRKAVTIVGLAGDSRHFSFTESARPHFYWPFEQTYQPGQHIVLFLKTAGEPEAAVPTLRSAAASIDSSYGAFAAAPLSEYNSVLLLPQKLTASLLNALGLIALLLAGVGLYGVMSYSVGQRTQELGIRMALGARPMEALRGILGHVLLVTAAGIAIGAAGGLAIARLIGSWLTGIRAFDPITFASASVFLLLVAVLASAIPAWRVTRMDPFTALRSE